MAVLKRNCMSYNFIVEIGVEELPAVPLIKELGNIEGKYKKILEENKLDCEFDFFYTPRRLVFAHTNMKEKQDDYVQEFFGAPKSIAFKDGVITGAGKSFLGKHSISEGDVETTDKNGKEVLYYKKSVKGEKLGELIEGILNKFLASLVFGKTMRWGRGEKSFIRPIRWILLKFNEQTLNANCYGVASLGVSYGHRDIGYEPFEVSSSGDYLGLVAKNKIILNQDDRFDIIKKEVSKLEKSHNISIALDSDLLNEIVAITEYPTPLLGSFDEEFLELPFEVVVTSMKEHQRYFDVYENGKLTNKFIVVSNSTCVNQDKVKQGNEKVLKARLQDAMFFYHNDIKNGLSNDGLENIIFINKLGSIKDKVDRETKIVEIMALELEVQSDIALKSIKLSKADLLSEMVYEFTELQGVMGYYYALNMKEDEAVALGIKEQYYPLSEDGELPSSLDGAIVSISCKFDLIFALFSIGMIPSGSKDPYALRRASIGILRIIREFDLDIDLKKVFNKLAPIYDSKIEYESIEKFFYERFAGFMDVNKSAINAVLSTKESNLNNIIKKISSLSMVLEQDSFRKNFSFIKRISNILNSNNKIENVKSELFETDYEHNLYDNFIKIRDEKFETYFDKLEALFSLEVYLSEFFDNVMVNSDDEAIKINRTSLLNEINLEFKKIADIKMLSKD